MYLRDTTFNGNHYEVGLPWKEESFPHLSKLQNNQSIHNQCNRLTSFTSLFNRLKHDPSLLREYSAIIEEQIEQGIVEKKEIIQHSTIYLIMGLFEMVKIRQSYVHFFMNVPKESITNSL